MKALDPLKRRLMMMIGRAVISAVNDGTKAQSLQVTLLDGEVADGVERFQEYGFTSAPFPGAEAVMACVGGLRSHGIVIAIEDRRYRLIGLQAGEVALYDDQGQKVHLTRAGIIISSVHQVTVTAPKVVVNSDDVELGGAGGAAVARVGDAVSGGVITGGSAKVKAA